MKAILITGDRDETIILNINNTQPIIVISKVVSRTQHKEIIAFKTYQLMQQRANGDLIYKRVV